MSLLPIVQTSAMEVFFIIWNFSIGLSNY